MIDSSPHLTWTNVFIGFLFVIFDSVLSIILGLGIASSLLIAAVRCVIQLSIMGLVLGKVFASNNIWGVAGIAGKLIMSMGLFIFIGKKTKIKSRVMVEKNSAEEGMR